MKLIDAIELWANETYGGRVTLEDWTISWDIRIDGWPQGEVYDSFVVINHANYHRDYNGNDKYRNVYLYPSDPEFFNKLKSIIDMAMHYRQNWANEINDEEDEMLTEEIYLQGGYAT